MPDYDVIVIGAGLGGLSTAALCARHGFRTLVIEQSDIVGGCCSTFEADGYRFDVGASIVEVTRPLDALFELMVAAGPTTWISSPAIPSIPSLPRTAAGSPTPPT